MKATGFIIIILFLTTPVFNPLRTFNMLYHVTYTFQQFYGSVFKYIHVIIDEVYWTIHYKINQQCNHKKRHWRRKIFITYKNKSLLVLYHKKNLEWFIIFLFLYYILVYTNLAINQQKMEGLFLYKMNIFNSYILYTYKYNYIEQFSFCIFNIRIH